MTSPNPNPGVRVGDRERTAVADRLAAHSAAGRLTVDELEQRVERAHAATHTTDLDALLADLPERSRTPARRRRAPDPFIGAAFVAAIIATVALSIAVRHPVPPVFLLVLLVWRLRWRLS